MFTSLPLCIFVVIWTFATAIRVGVSILFLLLDYSFHCNNFKTKFWSIIHCEFLYHQSFISFFTFFKSANQRYKIPMNYHIDAWCLYFFVFFFYLYVQILEASSCFIPCGCFYKCIRNLGCRNLMISYSFSNDH